MLYRHPFPKSSNKKSWIWNIDYEIHNMHFRKNNLLIIQNLAWRRFHTHTHSAALLIFFRSSIWGPMLSKLTEFAANIPDPATANFITRKTTCNEMVFIPRTLLRYWWSTYLEHRFPEIRYLHKQEVHRRVFREMERMLLQHELQDHSFLYAYSKISGASMEFYCSSS